MSSHPLASLLRTQADALEAQARVLRATADALEVGGPITSEQGLPTYATAKCNPMGSARSFHAALRSGRYAVVKLGRSPAISWSDAEAWISDHARLPTPAPSSAAAPDPSTPEGRRAMLEKCGGVIMRPRRPKR